MRTPPLDNVKVRQAIMAALNRKLIVNNIFFGLGKVATSPFVTTEMFYDKNMPPLDFNMKKARAPDRKSVVEGKSVSVRLDLGGRRIIQKKKIINKQHKKR